ncbi:XRE family transcriptional regulator [Hoeflea sp.]|uniref:helix-turn-helix domain-containing protein n=1 Tax=Hoeflea sp. TaxID=1940281 RepID=UPI0019C9F4D1|nr:XRE family transcriptional regulator [Hoeflea sp.]MBC7285908.1 helix-turn-helix transcriptional regulator [Hoeflea sp.]
MSKSSETVRSRRKISHHGHRIRHARLLKGYTLRQLADQVECSESMISKLENSRLSPSLAMLHRLAEVLETSVPDLLILDDEDTGAAPVTVFPPERFLKLPHQAEEDESRLVWFDRILPFNRAGLLQANLLHLAPGAEQPRFLQHEGEEFIFVLDGTLDVVVQDTVYPVAAGGMIFFSSTLDHRYANSWTEMVRALWVNTPPTM